jgi:hypothetical protein
VEVAAITHNIGVRLSEEKYGSAAGEYLEIEGPPEAEKLLRKIGYEEEFIDKICFLISHRNTYKNYDNAPYQILTEANFLVNLAENMVSVELAKSMRKEGYENFGLLLDMSHIPIMHETLESAVEKCRDVLTHIHMGNAVIKNKLSPFYGDKHIPWSYPDSEYTEKDGVTFIKLLKEIGYTEQENATASFEMRPYENMGAMQTLEKFVFVWQSAQ